MQVLLLLGHNTYTRVQVGLNVYDVSVALSVSVHGYKYDEICSMYVSVFVYGKMGLVWQLVEYNE